MTSVTDSPSLPPVHPRGFLRRHAGKLVASLVITCGIVLMVHKGGLKFLPEGGDFAQFVRRWWTLPLYLLFLLAMTYFRSVRWRFLLRSIAEVPKARLFAVSCVGFAAILLMPFRLGEIVRPYLIRTPPSKRLQTTRAITLTAATSSVVAERIIDGLYLSIVLALALIFVPTVHPLPDRVVGIPVTVAHVRMSGYVMLALFATLFTTLAVFYFARSWAHRATLIVVGKVSTKLAERLTGLFEKLVDGLHVFGRGKDALGFFVETTFYWTLNAVGMWLLAWGCGVVHEGGSGPSLGEAFGLMGMLGCAILIPGPPGMLGVFQAGIYSGMTMFYPTSVVTGPGAAYVFLMYAAQVVFQLLAGGIGFLSLEPAGRSPFGALKAGDSIAPADA
ncbi:MAG: lysylphosphatidylglycerol synthase transmembrane domain-containing protein [Polyangiaceae bacterium]